MAERTSKLWIPKGIPIDYEKNSPNSSNLADYIINLKADDIHYKTIMDIFGEFNGKSLAHSYDLLEAPAKSFTYYIDNTKTKFKSNVSKFTTTLGIWIINVFLRDYNISHEFNGYLNKTITKKVNGSIESTLSYGVLEDRLTTDQLEKWEDTVQWLMPFETILSPNHTEKMITCTTAINKKKKELEKIYADDIKKGNIDVVKKMEDELLDYAKEYMGDDPSMDTIYSGAVCDWGNNFKNMFVMRGAVLNPDPNAKQKYDIVTSNYIDGIKAEDYAVMAGSSAQGAYSRGKKTENGGYFEKLFVEAYQHITLDPPGSDCGTTRHITVLLDDKNINDYMYCYIIRSNGSLELLDTTNRDKYIGKTVNFRFASMCKSKTGICNKCAGELFYILNNKNIGATMAQIPDVQKNLAMKAFHDLQVNLSTMDPMKAFYPFGQ